MGKGGGIPMVGGRGDNSYFDNSAFPESRILTIKDMVNQVIHDKFDMPNNMGTIRIADLGCSVGPNAFYSIQAVIDAVLMKLNGLPGDHGETPEFFVFFNDQIGNDFNLLFSSIPSDQRYSVAGVPGSFYSRLFPRASINYVNSSLALHWLSRAPDGVANKGRVHIYGGGRDVLDAYSLQFRCDMEQFLCARAEELVPGGLMVLQFLCRPESVAPDAARHDLWFAFLEPVFQELVCEGKVKEEELDSFQVPIYAPTIPEFKEAVEWNGCFTIHVAQLVNDGWGLKGGGDDGRELDVEQLARSMGEASRAVFEIMVRNHFGEEIVEELFQRLPSKIYHHFASQLPHMPSPPPTALFILQRNPPSS